MRRVQAELKRVKGSLTALASKLSVSLASDGIHLLCDTDEGALLPVTTLSSKSIVAELSSAENDRMQRDLESAKQEIKEAIAGAVETL